MVRIEHRERLAVLGTLKPREREALYLHGLGHTYDEIATLTGSTRTAVNRRITEGRAALARAAASPATAAAATRPRPHPERLVLAHEPATLLSRPHQNESGAPASQLVLALEGVWAEIPAGTPTCRR